MIEALRMSDHQRSAIASIVDLSPELAALAVMYVHNPDRFVSDENIPRHLRKLVEQSASHLLQPAQEQS